MTLVNHTEPDQPRPVVEGRNRNKRVLIAVCCEEKKKNDRGSCSTSFYSLYSRPSDFSSSHHNQLKYLRGSVDTWWKCGNSNDFGIAIIKCILCVDSWGSRLGGWIIVVVVGYWCCFGVVVVAVVVTALNRWQFYWL